jgi:predicted DNA-binding WGR domain protein
MRQYFEYAADVPAKFWERWIEDTTMFTRFGKIGANGQATIKEFPVADATQKAPDKLLPKQ